MILKPFVHSFSWKVKCKLKPWWDATNSKCWWGDGEKRTLLHCWWECKMMQPLWKTVWRFLKILKIELLYDPAIPFLGIYPKKTKTLIQKYIHTPMFISALFTITKTWRQPICLLTDAWKKKMWYIQWKIIQP